MWRYEEMMTEEVETAPSMVPLTIDEAETMTEEVATAPSMVPLTIDEAETAEQRIERLISENPLVIFTRSACYMCHVMRRLLSAVGVHPTVIELEEEEMEALAVRDNAGADGGAVEAPAVFIGGASVGGLERLIALHLSGNLIPKLREVGALW